MAFDLSTAQPIKTGFDINTAQPIEDVSSTNSTPEKFDPLPAALGTGLAAAGLGLGHALTRFDLRGERKKLRNELLGTQKNFLGMGKTTPGIRGELGITEKVSPEDIPSRINTLRESANLESRSKINNLNAASKMFKADIRNLQSGIQKLDSETISPEINKLSAHIKVNYPIWNKSASDKYSASLDSLDGIFRSSGAILTNSQVEKNLIDKTIADISKQGFSADVIKPLLNAKEALQKQSTILGSSGKPIETPLNFSDVKTIVSNVLKEDPYGAPSSILRENWGKFLESNAPKEIAPALKNLNDSYQPFAQARSALNKIADPKTGEFDTAKLNKYLSTHVIKGADNGTDKLIGALSGKGTLADPIPGVAEQFENLKKLGTQRNALVETVKQIQQKTLTTPGEINKVQQEALSKSQKLLKTKMRARDIASRLKVLDEKIPSLNPIKVLGKAAGSVMRGGLRALGPVGMISQAAQFSEDPGNALRSMYFLPTKENEAKSLDENVRRQLQQLDIAVSEGKISRDKAASLANDIKLIRAGGI